VRVERYVKNLMIEAETQIQMVKTMVVPSCYSYSGDLAKMVADSKAAGVQAPQLETLSQVNQLISSLNQKTSVLEKAYQKLEALTSEEEKALYLSREISSLMEEVRQYSDELESLVGDDYWPLPKYREMLFST
jgi:glutamine synthetase